MTRPALEVPTLIQADVMKHQPCLSLTTSKSLPPTSFHISQSRLRIRTISLTRSSASLPTAYTTGRVHARVAHLQTTFLCSKYSIRVNEERGEQTNISLTKKNVLKFRMHCPLSVSNDLNQPPSKKLSHKFLGQRAQRRARNLHVIRQMMKTVAFSDGSAALALTFRRAGRSEVGGVVSRKGTGSSARRTQLIYKTIMGKTCTIK